MEKEWRNRMRFIIDMVFVSAMTILIITFQIPEAVGNASEKEFLKVLFSQGSNLATFVISFLVIAVYWVKNLEYFGVIEKIDKTFVWMQLLYLIFIMLLPVANLLFMLFPEGAGPRMLFSVLMILSGLIAYGGMYYAHRKNLLKKEFDFDYIKKFTKQLLSEPVIAAIAMGAAYINPYFWDAAFVLIPMVMVVSKKVKVKLAKR
ncbi:MAG: DUF1211 domain-containing protein [Cytophagales bacterium]|nr:DUF1211 domain-containing protein [Cytophagales bacterium]